MSNEKWQQEYFERENTKLLIEIVSGELLKKDERCNCGAGDDAGQVCHKGWCAIHK